MDDKIQEYLKQPYSRILIPDSETGGFAAQILEFPGCFSEGKTPQKAYLNLEKAAYNWLESAIKQNLEIPAPSSAEGYSGKVALRMPKSLHRQAMAMAKREGVSLNQFLVTAVATYVGAGSLFEKMADRLETKINVKYEFSDRALDLVSGITWSNVVANYPIGVACRVPLETPWFKCLTAARSSPAKQLLVESSGDVVQ